MRFLMTVGAVATLVVAFCWTARGRLSPARHPHADAPPAPASGTVAPGLPASTIAYVPRVLDGKIVLHLVPLADARTGCRVELTATENPFVDAALREGDVITEVAGEAVSARVALGLVNRIEQAGDAGVELTVLRDGQPTHVLARVAR